MVYDYLEISNRCNTGQKLEKERWDIDQIVLPTRQLVRTTNPKKLTATIRAADLLLGRDVYAGR
jgi:hypothetical protein